MNNQISIVAELAQGFEGNYEQARLLIKAAAAAGADAAKFQLVYADELATPDYKYYDLFRSLEMPDTAWEKLSSYSKELGIELHLDIFGSKSLQLCEKIGITAIKLHGTDIANIGLLHEIAECSIDKIMLGAGGAHLEEIETALNILENKKVTILLGFQGYPTPNETNQIQRIPVLNTYLKENFKNFNIGFADHADPNSPLRYAIASTAIGAGAVVIEKHLTLAKIMKMEDYESALNPDEFFEFTQIVRACANSIGKAKDQDDFGMSKSEFGYRQMIRRHVVSSKDISAGSVITPRDLVLKRTSSEDFITDLNFVYSKILKERIVSNTPITIKIIK